MSLLFQFLMVRLKVVYAINTNKFRIMFQFLMVRLKAKGASTFVIYQKFQFLMVRLKDSLDINKPWYTLLVSIPYGTIKRKWERVKFNVILVSIPYGTIKR